MKLSSFLRIIKFGILGFWRHGWLSLIASLILTITLLVISVSIIFNIVIESGSKTIQDKINISVYFSDETKDEEIASLAEILKKRIDVKEVEIISKDQALERWKNLQINKKIKEQITTSDNPLPRSLEIKAKDPQNLDSIVKYMEKSQYYPQISSISYQQSQNKDLIQRLINITSFSKKLGLGLSLGFIIVAILVILNTMQLAIYNRREEIEIMRFVGAGNNFIFLPFIVESILFAILATIFSMLMLWFGLNYLTDAVSHYLGDVNLNLGLFFRSNLYYIILWEFLSGLIISIICTMIALRKHLRA